jgi:membrane protease YdiL (CAAX protease family)
VQLVFFNNRGLRAGWRLMIFAGVLAGLGISIFALIQAFTRIVGAPREAATATPGRILLGEVLSFLVVALATWIMSRIERRAMDAYGLPLRPTPWSSFFTGYVVWGFLPLTLLLLAMRGLGLFFFDGLALRGSDIVYFAAVWGLTFLFVGLFEEYLFRGYVLFTLADGMGFWPAAIVLALLFGYVHMGNSGETRIGIIDVCLFAIFAVVTLRLTGNLWLAVGAHAGWDWGQSFVYGVSDSGTPAVGHLLNSHSQGPDWLSGGSVGPEGSVLSSLMQVVMILAFIVIYRRRQPASSNGTSPSLTTDYT